MISFVEMAYFVFEYFNFIYTYLYYSAVAHHRRLHYYVAGATFSLAPRPSVRPSRVSVCSPNRKAVETSNSKNT